ncbi:hypothetical protein M9H77_26142 [Catharanthus roseus]|uniref:Uncharacterized protein n=1 Tax=Catharanthus roseus TaxID=4058 RepID=A0ACC0A9Q4_CATRO|nr:hypothetical protein M9H77_26142 [Catharanthus roseus]
MKNTIRCCISCILPCGALDVIRIVHANGRVEELSGTIKAEEIMKAHPKHVLKKPSSSSSSSEEAAAASGICPKIVIVPPDAELQRGKIYFLIPVPSPPSDQKKSQKRSSSSSRKKKREADQNGRNNNNNISMTNFVVSDRYLSEILSEKVSSQRDRRRGRAGVWRPHLESISETPSEV